MHMFEVTQNQLLFKNNIFCVIFFECVQEHAEFFLSLVLDAISLAFHHDMFSHKNDGVIQAASQITKRFFQLKPIMKRISDLSCRSLDIARNRYENESSRFQNRKASLVLALPTNNTLMHYLDYVGI